MALPTSLCLASALFAGPPSTMIGIPVDDLLFLAKELATQGQDYKRSHRKLAYWLQTR